MESVVEAHGFRGAVVVGRSGEIVFEGGWGLANDSAGLSFTPDTPVDGASLAKTLTAAGIWHLVGEGRVSPEDPVREFIPDFPHSGTTIGHLLDHSAGLNELDEVQGLTNEGIVSELEETPAFVPGSRFSYCNECFDVLALLTERVTGQDWDVFVEERFFRPLAMDSAFVRPALFSAWPGTRTRSYRRIQGEVILFDVADDEPFYGSSNVYLSARDLFRWANGMMNGEVVPSDVVERANDRTLFSSGERSALNRLNWYQKSKGGAAYFDGHLRGFHSVVYWDPESHLVVAWVSNVLEGRPVEIQLTRALIDIASSGRTPSLPSFPGTPDTVVAAGGLEGRYRVPDLGGVTVASNDELLEVSIEDGPTHVGYPSHGFYLPDLGVELGFSDVVNGRPQRIHWLTVFDSVVGQRLPE